MLWYEDTNNPRTKHYKDGETVIGTVIWNERAKLYAAAVPKLYLGLHLTEGLAMDAIEKYVKEQNDA